MSKKIQEKLHNYRHAGLFQTRFQTQFQARLQTRFLFGIYARKRLVTDKVSLFGIYARERLLILLHDVVRNPTRRQCSKKSGRPKLS